MNRKANKIDDGKSSGGSNHRNPVPSAGEVGPAVPLHLQVVALSNRHHALHPPPPDQDQVPQHAHSPAALAPLLGGARNPKQRRGGGAGGADAPSDVLQQQHQGPRVL
ncbi:hypothetical protein Fmac_013695 [Flemingia macrophylla]|uniref:Uncharacterized protein n=1 Tax=Flemingia macrophylla TaxID=520843 RepID=A0ABD1MTX9_9FABA